MEEIKFFDVIASTNLYLKENYSKLNNLASVVACHQTNGRGRLGRVWSDSDDLLMSILIKDDLDLEKIENLSLVICTSIFKVLKKYLKNVKIKWPNDLLINEKKVCGILLESVISNKLEALIIGFGININTKAFETDLAKRATSMFLETNTLYDIEKLAYEVYNEFLNDYSSYLKGSKEYLKICKENSCLINKKITYLENGEERVSEVLDILENGHILLKTNDKIIEKSSGEITLHYNYEQSDYK